jgi:DNA-binding PadR family transcriptional regulator
MSHLYAIQREILDYLDDQPTADTTAIRRRLAYTADVSITYDTLEPHLAQLEERGLVQSRRADGSGTTYYRRADAAPVQPQTASD